MSKQLHYDRYKRADLIRERASFDTHDETKARVRDRAAHWLRKVDPDATVQAPQSDADRLREQKAVAFVLVHLRDQGPAMKFPAPESLVSLGVRIALEEYWITLGKGARLGSLAYHLTKRGRARLPRLLTQIAEHAP